MDKYWGHRNKKHKKQPFADASVSHLPLVLWNVWFQAGAWISHTTPRTPPSYEVGGIAKRIKNRSPSAKNPIGTWYFTSAHNFNTILIINYLSRTRNIAFLPCKIVLEIDTTSFQEIILLSGVFRRETASGFYPWGNVVSPRKRVAEGLCGWRHGNLFPMTQSAQSHRQMRSIPHCPKAVFYVFVFLFHWRFGNKA